MPGNDDLRETRGVNGARVEKDGREKEGSGMPGKEMVTVGIRDQSARPAILGVLVSLGDLFRSQKG